MASNELIPLTEKKQRRLTEKYVGKKFNLLTITEIIGKDEEGHTHCMAWCECGKDGLKRLNNIMSGTTKSCGCLKPAASRANIQAYYVEHNRMKEEIKQLKKENDRLLHQLMKYQSEVFIKKWKEEESK